MRFCLYPNCLKHSNGILAINTLSTANCIAIVCNCTQHLRTSVDKPHKQHDINTNVKNKKTKKTETTKYIYRTHLSINAHSDTRFKRYKKSNTSVWHKWWSANHIVSQCSHSCGQTDYIGTTAKYNRYLSGGGGGGGRETETERQTETETERDTERQTETETDRQTDRQRQDRGDTERGRYRDRDTH